MFFLFSTLNMYYVVGGEGFGPKVWHVRRVNETKNESYEESDKLRFLMLMFHNNECENFISLIKEKLQI